MKKIKKNQVFLENNLKAYYDKKIGRLKAGDKVLVYGNLVLRKINEKQNFN